MCKHAATFEEYLSSPDWAGPDWKKGGLSQESWREIIACGMDALRQRADAKGADEDPLGDPQVLHRHTTLQNAGTEAQNPTPYFRKQ